METTQQTFEEKMRLLETLVSKLENGQLPLEESLNAYETAMQLSKALEEELDAAQKRVMVFEQGQSVPLEADDL